MFVSTSLGTEFNSEVFSQFTFVLERNYPMLPQLAALFLGMLAGSVHVECLFSVRLTGLICNSRRSRICPSKLNKISFLHDNLHYIGYCLFAMSKVTSL